MTLLITGGSGTLGSAVCREARDHNETVVAYSRDRSRQLSQCPFRTITETGDVRDIYRLVHVCRKHNVDSVVHCAAAKHVGECEERPAIACDTNIGGVQNVLAAIEECNIPRAVFVSSDKSGDNTVYGMTKLLGERLVTEAALQTGRLLNCVRLGNLMGSNGSVLQLWRAAVAEGRPITLHQHNGRTANRFVMHPHEAARFIWEVLGMSGIGTVQFRGMPVINMEILQQIVAPDSKVIPGPLNPDWLEQTILSEREAPFATRAHGIVTILQTLQRDACGSPYSTLLTPALSLEATREWLAAANPPPSPRSVCS
uniref:Putative polysaccharide biosynthesis protein n=1 Tax=viral metagenome TaxID=1070528 RepID=A0A6M3IH53_9ZZZZ